VSVIRHGDFDNTKTKLLMCQLFFKIKQMAIIFVTFVPSLCPLWLNLRNKLDKALFEMLRLCGKKTAAKFHREGFFKLRKSLVHGV